MVVTPPFTVARNCPATHDPVRALREVDNDVGVGAHSRFRCCVEVENVDAQSARHGVFASAPDQEVVARTGIERVGARAAIDRFVFPIADELIGVAGQDEAFNKDETVAGCSFGCTNPLPRWSGKHSR